MIRLRSCFMDERPRVKKDIANWTNVIGLVASAAAAYPSTSGGCLAVGGGAH